MAPRLKQSAASGTASEHSVFFWARLKLTGVYVCIIGLILFGFSIVLYQNLQQSLADAADENFAGVETHHQFVQSTLSSVASEIILIDVIILLASAGAGYILAGYTLRPIQNSVEAQRKFSEHASHELRTPIAVMKNAAEVLLRNPNPAKELVRATLQSNIEEMDRMSTMTEDLLMLARSQNKNAAFNSVNLAEIARHMAQKLQPLAQIKGVALEVPHSNTVMVSGFKEGIERVIMNLLQNAIEHTPHGGSVTLSVSHSNSKATLTVTDTGQGIDAKDLPHIFERFYKAESTGANVSGSGLGLSIVKELVDQHRGNIAITSIKGEGTRVLIQFPLSG